MKYIPPGGILYVIFVSQKETDTVLKGTVSVSANLQTMRAQPLHVNSSYLLPSKNGGQSAAGISREV